MNPSSKTAKARKANNIQYICSGIYISASGLMYMERYFTAGLITAALGILLLGWFIYTKKRQSSPGLLDALAYFVEAAGYVMAGLIFIFEDRNFLQYMSFAAAAGFVTAGIVFLSKRNTQVR